MFRFLVTAAVIAAACPAYAEEGTFRLALPMEASTKAIDHAGGVIRFAVHLQGEAQIMDASGAPFSGLDQVTMDGVGAGFQASEILSIEAYMTLTMPNGDQFYILAVRTEGDMEPAGGGSGGVVIQGGTGQFAGITGECKYEVEYSERSRAEVQADCSWRRD